MLELAITLFCFGALIILIKRMRFSHIVFTFLVLIIPTLTGTLTSMPRYTLTGFLIFPVLAKYYPKAVKFAMPFLVILQVVLIFNFIRGYWVA